MRVNLASLLPDSIKQNDEPVFDAPWQAQAFAMAVLLMEAGRIELDEWAQALGQEIENAAANGLAEDGSDYYKLWLAALEKQVLLHELTDAEELGCIAQAWREAYANTPHGEPVTLQPGPDPGPTG